MSERDTQKAIMDLLAAEGILAFRMNSGAMLASYKGKKRLIRFGEPGMADILAFPQGRVLWIEVKSAKGRQTQEQLWFENRVVSEGHQYLVTSDVSDLMALLS